MDMSTCTKRHDILKRKLTVALQTLGLRSSLRISIIQTLKIATSVQYGEASRVQHKDKGKQ